MKQSLVPLICTIILTSSLTAMYQTTQEVEAKPYQPCITSEVYAVRAQEFLTEIQKTYPSPVFNEFVYAYLLYKTQDHNTPSDEKTDFSELFDRMVTEHIFIQKCAECSVFYQHQTLLTLSNFAQGYLALLNLHHVEPSAFKIAYNKTNTKKIASNEIKLFAQAILNLVQAQQTQAQ